MAEFFKCSVCGMFHKSGFQFRRDPALIEKTTIDGVKEFTEPPTWVWRTPPAEAAAE
jgi:hypothetical protein